jgi:hypothetical protein
MMRIMRTRIITKTPKTNRPQIFQLQIPGSDDESWLLFDFPLHRVKVGYSKRALKAFCHLTSNSMMTGIADSEVAGC